VEAETLYKEEVKQHWDAMITPLAGVVVSLPRHVRLIQARRSRKKSSARFRRRLRIE
jgi:hypothetical protein